MGQPTQSIWQQVAREKFDNFSVRGDGPFAVLDCATGIVQLFTFRMEAATHGHVIEIQPPAPRPRFRQPFIRD